MTIFVLSLIVVAVLTLYTAMLFISTADDAKYIKMEIQRSSHESEIKRWKRKLKRVYCSRIPIIGNLIFKIFFDRK